MSVRRFIVVTCASSVLALPASAARSDAEAKSAAPDAQSVDRPRPIPCRAETAPGLDGERTLYRPERTVVLVRAQVKYNLGRVKRQHGAFVNHVTETPLFQDRELYDPSVVGKGEVDWLPIASYAKDLAIARSCGIDGFAVWANAGGAHDIMWDRMAAHHAKLRPPDFYQVFHHSGSRLAPEGAYYERMRDALRRAVDDPWVLKFGPRVVIVAYHSARRKDSIERTRQALANLREELGDVFVYVADLSGGIWNPPSFNLKHYTTGIPEDRTGQVKEELRAWLEFSDGISYTPGSHINKPRDPLGSLPKPLGLDYYRNYIVKTMKEVLAEPPYRQKLLGLTSAVGYVNDMTGSINDEHGTWRLRALFDVAREVKPDIILMPEWNEDNENTHIQPTIYDSLSTQRILKYYTNLFKGLPPEPNPGDDLSIPNLILCLRPEIKIGEPVEFEILNLPDGHGRGEYVATLRLLDLEGKQVHAFPPARLAADRLCEARPTLPSEDFAAHRVLRPELTVVKPDGATLVYRDLMHLRIHPTAHYNYNWVKQPLRDLYRPAKAEFRLANRPAPGAPAEFDVAIEGDEPIARAEILEGNHIAYHHLARNGFDQSTHDVYEFEFIATGDKDRVSLKGFCRVDHSDVLVYGGYWYGQREIVKEEGGFRLDKDYVGKQRYTAYFVLPKATRDQARLRLDLLDRQVFDLPVREIREKRSLGWFVDERLFLYLHAYERTPATGPHLKTRDVAFRLAMTPEDALPVYFPRVVTRSGKIYRGAPILPWAPPSGNPVVMPVASNLRKQVVDVTVPRGDLLDLVYEFSPDHGVLLWTAAGRRWMGEIGQGHHYGRPFKRGKLPEDARLVPEWVGDGDGWILRFDGKGTFVVLPVEAMPQGAFTLEMEVRPASLEGQQTLFSHTGHYPNGLRLWIEPGGELQADFIGRPLGENTRPLNPGLTMRAGEWQRVRVTHDLRELVFEVDDQRAAVPSRGLARSVSCSTVGGEKLGRWFHGDLRALRILHGATR